MSEWERLFFTKTPLQTTNWKNTKINCKIAGEIPNQIWYFQELKPCLAFLLQIRSMLMYQWWLFGWLTLCQKLVCCRNKADGNARKCGPKNFSQCHSTLYFWRQVPESKYPEFKMPVYSSFLCIAQHIAVNFFFCDEVRKIKTILQPWKTNTWEN